MERSQSKCRDGLILHRGKDVVLYLECYSLLLWGESLLQASSLPREFNAYSDTSEI